MHRVHGIIHDNEVEITLITTVIPPKKANVNGMAYPHGSGTGPAEKTRYQYAIRYNVLL